MDSLRSLVLETSALNHSAISPPKAAGGEDVPKRSTPYSQRKYLPQLINPTDKFVPAVGVHISDWFDFPFFFETANNDVNRGEKTRIVIRIKTSLKQFLANFDWSKQFIRPCRRHKQVSDRVGQTGRFRGFVLGAGKRIQSRDCLTELLNSFFSRLLLV